MTTSCKHCDQGVKLTGKDHWIVQSIIPARIKIVRCEHLKDRIEWCIRSANGVTAAGYKNRAAAQKSADRSNAESPGQGWHVVKNIIEAPNPDLVAGENFA